MTEQEVRETLINEAKRQLKLLESQFDETLDESQRGARPLRYCTKKLDGIVAQMDWLREALVAMGDDTYKDVLDD